jgi:hypothetical protein
VVGFSKKKTMADITPSELRKPLHKLERNFKYYCDEVTPIIFVFLCLVYFFGKKFPFAPHIIVIGTLILIMTFFLNIYRHFYAYGWFFSIRECIRIFIGRSWVKILLMYDNIKGSWVGKTCTIFAVTNLFVFIPHWAWFNFPLISIAKNGFELATSFCFALSNPPAILKAFDAWVITMPWLARFLFFSDIYIQQTLNGNEKGNFFTIVWILLVSFGLCIVALVFYFACTFILRKKYCCKRNPKINPEIK